MKKALVSASAFFNEIRLRRVKYSLTRMWANFISHCDRREQYFTISEGNYFTFCRKTKYFTENAKDQISNAKAAFRLLFAFHLFGLRLIY
jgi:hypothetical protein